MGSRTIFQVAKNEYVKWITHPKMIILAVMFIFIYDFVIKELITAADKMGGKLQMFEGFVGIANSQLLLMIFPIVFVGLMGDFPRVDGNAMFYIYRVGRGEWFLGQVLFAVMASATYLLALFGFSTVSLIGRCYIENGWSEITTKYYLFSPNEYAGVVANLTTGRLYNNLTPIEATIHILFLMFLFLMMIAILLLVWFVYGFRIQGIVITAAILCVGNVLAYMDNRIRWVFPTSHSILEIHFDLIYKMPILDIRVSYIYYIGVIIMLYMVGIQGIKRLDFTKIQELEE